MKPRTVIVSFELHNARESARRIKEQIRWLFDDLSTLAAEGSAVVRQIQLNVSDATKPKDGRKERGRRP